VLRIKHEFILGVCTHEHEVLVRVYTQHFEYILTFVRIKICYYYRFPKLSILTN
jgi:hypothetical protein